MRRASPRKNNFANELSNATMSGSGPGVQTQDGCSVELYRQLPYAGELEEVLPLFPKGSVLELGCGTGRLCARLIEAGFAVTGVDNSQAMIDFLPNGVAGFCGHIETLRLPETFDSVLLASHLVNHPDAITRQAFLSCARRHLRVGGHLLVQRHDPEWLMTAVVGELGMLRSIAISIEAVSRVGRLVSMTLCYRNNDDEWRQSFSTLALEEREIEAEFEAAGFSNFTWHGNRRKWLAALAC
jgi:SAM-dependent methyltransferase